jgi:zinc/manganese transport system substrate-binding protein
MRLFLSRPIRTHGRARVFPFTAGALALAILTAGCSPSGTAGSDGLSGKAQAGSTVEVVASTDVYGDIVRVVGGDRVHISSIIHSPSQDPHSYEATSQDRLAMSKATLLVENGGGYDDFFDKLADSTVADKNRLINVTDLSGLASRTTSSPTDSGRTDFNEHLWYNFGVMTALADEIAGKLGAADEGHTTDFTANADRFKADLKTIQARVAELKNHHDGESIAVTEPVPLYLLEAAGLVNRTPENFSHAIEAGTEVPATIMKETENLISGHTIKFLAYNEQTVGQQTDALKKTANTAGIPVIGFTETLPADHTYLQWMSENVDHIDKALHP